MKALAHVILHQLLFAVWLLAMWVLYCTPACTHPIEHLIAAPFAVLIPTAVIMRRLCSDPRFARCSEGLGRFRTHCGMDVVRHARPCRNRPRVKEKTLKPAGRVIFSLLLPSGLRRGLRQDAGAMDRRVEVTSADGCAVRIRVPARHQSKGGKRCQAKHQAGRKARSGSNGHSRPPASA